MPVLCELSVIVVSYSQSVSQVQVQVQALGGRPGFLVTVAAEFQGLVYFLPYDDDDFGLRPT